uniref:SUZ RNA-binding domain-containing n=2 Tax=Bombyx mori TaxID=7091 RepID=A0A8R2AM81_BOMMO|nr:SUZ domain-containing protein 1 [Bombyx mori]
MKNLWLSVNMAAQDEVDVCESWEDMDEIIGLEQNIRLNSESPTENPPAISLRDCKVTVEENACIGSQCMMPEPAIRILKRPSSSGSGQLNGENRARPVKTLEQRQKEYEQARLRILGEARSPEDIIDDKLTRLQDKLQANNLNDSQSNNKKNGENAKSKERKVLSRLPPGATPAGVFPSPPPRGVLVIRTPRGPDGTKGFLKR